jgi:hypothetical protein
MTKIKKSVLYTLTFALLLFFALSMWHITGRELEGILESRPVLGKIAFAAMFTTLFGSSSVILLSAVPEERVFSQGGQIA